ncbi:MAG: hypothetical protein UH241_06005 [Acutalibacteraceae bacterium]|nr:hypothetical protein [Acutalibacteraceae bacterium]
MNNKEIIKKYSGAKEIYTLMRSKKLSKKEIIFDFAVALFTPFPGIVSEADLISDMGRYYLVVDENTNKLVRVQGTEITEQELPKNYNKKSFIVNRNKFTKVGKIYG